MTIKWERLLIGCWALLVPSLVFGADVSALVERTRQMIGDTPYYSPQPKITDNKIIDFLNEAQDYASANGWFLVKSTSIILVGGTTEYALPSDFQTAKRATLDNALLPERTLSDLDSNSGKWLNSSGKPSSYYIRQTTYTKVGFFPAPTMTTTGTVILDFVVTPTRLSATVDIPFNGVPELYPMHYSLCKYVVYRCYLLAGNVNMANIYAQEFLTDMQRMKGIIETKPNYRPGASAYPVPR